MRSELQAKIKILNELMWEGRLPWSDIERWLVQFGYSQDPARDEQLHALFLLSNFSYFNSRLMRVLLTALYRDFIQRPLLMRLRKRHKHTLSSDLLQKGFDRSLARIRFVGMGNPSESGTHLLYYFRQENNLATHLFLHPHELFEGKSASPRLISGVQRLIFIDDFCGSGIQASRYSREILKRARSLKASVEFSYYPLFATLGGLKEVRAKTLFDDAESVCQLDDSFRSLGPDSRYFRGARESISREFALELCSKYGNLIEPTAPLGFGRCQLLIGFSHNIPNNTLPVFWSTGNAAQQWTPIFPRYKKAEGW